MPYVTGDVLPLSEVNSKPRANFAQEDTVPYLIPLTAFRWADGSIPNTTGAAGNPKLVMGGYGSGTGIFQGEDAQAALKTETLTFDFAIPECYVASETVAVAVYARFNDAGTNTESTKTIDLECYEVAGAGTAGSDLCATAIQTLTATMAAYSFTITDAGLSAGDLLRIFTQCKLQGDSNGALKVEVGGAIVYLDIKG
uniref:Uncharacterized protein n=1 Tax=viral metagenome TaxID=1070528 RepID=A0A6M3ILY7_9ZZZZ